MAILLVLVFALCLAFLLLGEIFVELLELRTRRRRAAAAEAERRRRHATPKVIPLDPRRGWPEIRLPSGRWSWRYVEYASDFGAPLVYLHDPDNPRNEMVVELEEGAAAPGEDELRALSRDPIMRLWEDGDGVHWRLEVGYDVARATPIAGRKEDVERAVPRRWIRLGGQELGLPWAGLGHLTHSELQSWFDMSGAHDGGGGKPGGSRPRR